MSTLDLLPPAVPSEPSRRRTSRAGLARCLPPVAATLLAASVLTACSQDALLEQVRDRWQSVVPAVPAIRSSLLRQLRTAPSHDTGSDSPSCPPEMGRVGASCIDRFEAHIVLETDGVERVHPYNQPLCRDEAVAGKGAVARRLADRACEDTLRRIRARSNPNVFPQGYISQLQAERACFNAGKRLCTGAEWKSGCQGTRKTLWPYGSRPIPGVCNNGKAHVLTMFYGANPFGWSYAAFNDERLNAQQGFLEKTGALLDCTNDYGLFDMVGNLQEWVTDRVEQGPYRGRGVFVGSHFGNRGDEMGLGCHYQIRAHEPSYHDYSIGFRCCKNAN